MELRSIDILHLEDDDDHAALMKALLGRMSHLSCQLSRARTVAEAEAQLDDHAYDVILADLHLPDADPVQTIQRLLARRGAAPLVAITGSGGPELGPHAVSSGAQDFLTKDTLDPDHVERALRFAMEREFLTRRLQTRTEELSELLDLARTDLSDRLAEIALRCRELDERAHRTAVPSNSIWFRDTQRFAEQTRLLVESLHDHFDPTVHAHRVVTCRIRELSDIDRLTLDPELEDTTCAIPGPALRRALGTLAHAAPGQAVVMSGERVPGDPGRLRLALRGDSMAVETRGNLSADLFRSALSLELALAMRLSRFTLRRYGGDAWTEVRDSGQFTMHVELPLAGPGT